VNVLRAVETQVPETQRKVDAAISYAMNELPFGGSGASGNGRVHGVEGLRALCEE